jgi:hypothetical protein
MRRLADSRPVEMGDNVHIGPYCGATNGEIGLIKEK